MSNGSRAHAFPLVAGAIMGLLGVSAGAYGAHALKLTLTERGMVQAWETAARYHLLHAVGLLAVAALAANLGPRAQRLLRWTTHAWCAGTILFSGSLYWLALGGPRWLGPITPFGGIAFLLGWLLLAVTAFQKEPRT